MDWPEWHKWFVVLYGANDWIDATVSLWIREMFIPGGFEVEEVRAASVAVAHVGFAARPHEILKQLIAEVRHTRAEALMAYEDQERRGVSEEPIAECRWCDGQGWAIVPHHPQPAFAVAKGFLATHAVRCRCHAGQRLSRRSQLSMSLDAYEFSNPGWHELRQWWEKKLAADGKVKRMTKSWDDAEEKMLKGFNEAEDRLLKQAKEARKKQGRSAR